MEADIERFDASEENFRERSRIKGRRTADRQLAKVLPFFTSRKVELRDVKVLFHPVDYIAFCGMSSGQCLSVDFVDRLPESRAREVLQRSIDEAIQHARIEWQIYRISADGLVTASGRGRRPKS